MTKNDDQEEFRIAAMDDSSRVYLQMSVPSQLRFNVEASKPLLIFSADGTIELGEGALASEAAQEFLDWLRPHFDQQVNGRVRALLELLDNIDTLDDSCREHDDEFRRLTREQLKKRFSVVAEPPDLASDPAKLRKALAWHVERANSLAKLLYTFEDGKGTY